MKFMEADQRACDELLPGLREALGGIPLSELEAEDATAIEMFRSYGGSNLLVPKEFGGIGGTALEAVRVVRVLGSLAPSMTVATMMHHFSVGTLYAMAQAVVAGPGLGGALLRRIPAERLLLASGFAEGRTDQGILTPMLRAHPVAGGYRISGSKKPCSLSRSMDLLTASVCVESSDGPERMGLLVLPADTRGLSVHPFWSSFALAGAQSHEVRLDDVFVTGDQIVVPELGMLPLLIEMQTVGLILFQLTVCAAYTGMASALVDRVLRRSRGGAADRARLAVRIESAAALTEGLARRVMDGETGNDALATALVTRFTVQEAVAKTVDQAVELLGGMAYVSSSDVAYLAAASHAIAFHPPSRTSSAEHLLDYYAGQVLVVS